jgi:MFS family permease
LPRCTSPIPSFCSDFVSCFVFALAFFSLGIPLGSALGIFFGAWLASHFDWRSAFLIVGLAGLPAALLVRLLIPEPVRGGRDGEDGTASAPAPPFLEKITRPNRPSESQRRLHQHRDTPGKPRSFFPNKPACPEQNRQRHCAGNERR